MVLLGPESTTASRLPPLAIVIMGVLHEAGFGGHSVMQASFSAPPFVNLRLKRYQPLALQTVPVGESEPGLAQVVLFALSFFGRRPGWRFGTV